MIRKNFLFRIALFFVFTTSVFSEIYSKSAIVSYYAEDFHGKKTSNGETFNMNALTCASKELPFGTKVRVTNLSNGKSVVVRVNDRGPFVPDRELDLSKAAAIKLDMIKSGTATVKIEIIEWGKNTEVSKQTAVKAVAIMKKRFPGWQPHGKNTSTSVKKVITAAKSTSNYPENKLWDIQLGAFSSRENANVLAQKLLKQGFTDVVFQKGEGIYRVVIRQVPSKDLEKIENKLQKNGHNEYTIRERKV